MHLSHVRYWHKADIGFRGPMSALEVKRAFIVLPQRRARLGSGEAALLLSQSVCGGSPSSLSLAVSIAMRMSASARVRFSLNASSS